MRHLRRLAKPMTYWPIHQDSEGKPTNQCHPGQYKATIHRTRRNISTNRSTRGMLTWWEAKVSTDYFWAFFSVFQSFVNHVKDTFNQVADCVGSMEKSVMANSGLSVGSIPMSFKFVSVDCLSFIASSPSNTWHLALWPAHCSWCSNVFSAAARSWHNIYVQLFPICNRELSCLARIFLALDIGNMRSSKGVGSIGVGSKQRLIEGNSQTWSTGSQEHNSYSHTVYSYRLVKLDAVPPDLFLGVSFLFPTHSVSTPFKQSVAIGHFHLTLSSLPFCWFATCASTANVNSHWQSD